MKTYASDPESSPARTITVVLHLPVQKIALLVPGLVVLLTFTTLSALALFDIGGVLAQENAPGAPQEVTAFTSAGTLNFQGELRDQSSSAPLADGEYRMRFAIYDAESGGNKLWPAPTPDYEEHTTVGLADGLFNLLLGSQLTIPGDVFENGGDRYLQIWVCPTAGMGCTNFEDLGRLPISSVGYAKAFVPGATVSGTGMVLGLSSSATSGSVLTVNAQAPTGNAAGVYASSNAPSGAGLSGYNASSGYGVYGASVSGAGVFGFASAASGENFGVHGRNNSLNGAGVYGESNNSDGVGVYGEIAFGTGTGVRGDSAAGAGVYGSSVSGTGVYGTAAISGTVGIATRNTGTNYGVYGRNASANGAGVYGASTHLDGYGIYSDGDARVDGDAHVEGNLTWKAKTGYISVPAAAFRPDRNDIDYQNNGFEVWHRGSVLTFRTFYAPVYLPHTAKLKTFTVQMCSQRSMSAEYFELRLLRYDSMAAFADGPVEIAILRLPNGVGAESCATASTNIFAYDAIDNSRYSYYLGAWMIGTLGTDIVVASPRSVIIEYEFSEPY